MKYLFVAGLGNVEVDDVDFLYLVGFNWSKSGSNYAHAWMDSKHQYLHRVIAVRAGIALHDGIEIDHKDLNPLNCRRDNLRPATRVQNQANTKPKAGHRFKGIRLNHGKWEVRIRVNGTRIHLGRYDTPEFAAEVYRAAAKRHFGEFAYNTDKEDNK